MRYFTFISFLLFGIITYAQKKVDIGVTMGIGHAGLYNTKAEQVNGWKTEGETSFSLGLSFDNRLNDRSTIFFEFQVGTIKAQELNCPWTKYYQSASYNGPHYTPKPSYYDTITSNLTIETFRFQMPILYRRYFQKASVGAGIFITTNLKRQVYSSETSHSWRLGQGEEVDGLMSDMDFGLVLDVGFRLCKELDIFLRYNQGVIDLWQNEENFFYGYYVATSVYSMQGLVGFRIFFNRNDQLSSTSATSPDN